MRILPLFFVVYLSFCAHVAWGSSRELLSTSSEEANLILKTRVNIPRYTFFTSGNKLVRYPSSFCGGAEYEDCDWHEYAESIFLTSGVALVLGLITLVLGVVFWTFRACCFGGCRGTTGVCIPGEPFTLDQGEGYTRREVWFIRIGIILVFVFMVPFFILGHTGNKRATTTVDTFGETMIGSVKQVVDTMTYINTTLASLDYDQLPFNQSDITNLLDMALIGSRKVYGHGVKLQDIAQTFNHYHSSVEIAILIIPVLMIAFAAVAGITGLAKLAGITATLGFLALAILWTSFSFHYPITLVLSDICSLFAQGVGNIVRNIGSGADFDSNPLIGILEQCANGTGDPFQPIKNIATDGITYAFGLVCTGFAAACNQTYTCYPNGYLQPSQECPALQCSPDPDAPCTQDKVDQYQLTTNVTDFDMGCVDLVLQQVDCTNKQGSGSPCPSDRYAPCDLRYVPFVDCPSQCRQDEFANATQQVNEGIVLLLTYEEVLNDHIFPLLNCTILTTLIDNVESLMCVNLTNEVYYITVAEGGLCCLLTIGVILSILGIKRFNIHNHKLSEKELQAYDVYNY